MTPPHANDRWFTPGRTALFLAALLVAVYPEVFLGFESFYYRDFGLFGYPLAAYHRACFWRGEFPLWNPFSNCGIPYLAQWNTMVLYPGSLLYLLFPLPWSLNVFCLGHLVLAGVGMHVLAQRWTGSALAGAVAGVGFAFNGLALNCLMWPNNMAALAWMPWVILCLERLWTEGGKRRAATAALVGALQMLAGAPEIVLFTWLILGVLCGLTPGNAPALGRRLAQLSGVGLLVLGLAAMQLLPFLDLLKNSQRDATFGGGRWSMPGWGWANLLVPLFRCSPSLAGVYSQDDQQWTSSYYPGIGMLLLGLGALAWKRSGRVGVLAGLTLGSIVLAMGDNGIVLPLLKKILPPLGLIRFPVKFMVVTLWALPLLAAHGIAAWQQLASANETAAKSWRPWLWTGGALTVLIGILMVVAWRYPFPGEVWNTTWNSGASRVLFLAAILGLMVCARRLPRPWMRAASPWALMILLALDVLTHAPHQNPTVQARALAPGALEAAPELRPGQGRAMISPYFRTVLASAGNPDAFQATVGQRQSRFPNWNLLDEVALVDGFFSLYLKPQREIWEALYGSLEHYPRALADFLGVSTITSDQEWFVWLPRATAKPWITAGQRPVTAPDTAVLESLKNSEFDPGAVVYLAAEEGLPAAPAKPCRARLLSQRLTSHRIEAEIEAEDQAMVVIAQTYHHGWNATVDGATVPLRRANYAFQALTVPAGRHRIVLEFRDRTFTRGLAVSGLSAALCLVLLVGRPTRPTTSQAPGLPVERWTLNVERWTLRVFHALFKARAHRPSIAMPVPQVGADGLGAWLTTGRFALVLGVLVLALYPGAILGGSTFYYRDFGIFGYPLAYFHRESFWRGEIPLWNPLNNCGVPFLAQWNTMTLYPGTLLYLLLPLSWSLGVFCLGHMFWAGLGMFVLIRTWTGHRLAAAVAGVAFAFNGLTWHALMWPNNIAALGWMPWVVWLTQRAWKQGGAYLLWAALGGAMQMLSGAPEVIFLTWIIVGAMWLTNTIVLRSSDQSDLSDSSERSDIARWPMFWRAGLVVALVAVLSAAQLLPFLDFLAHSQRHDGYSDGEWSMPGTGWANFVLPAFHTFESFLGVQVQRGQYWTTSYYLGAGVVGLALFAVWRVRQAKVWVLAGLGLLGAVLALGNEGGLFPLLMQHVPQLGFMRFPIKFVVLPIFVIPVLAGWAIQEWLRAKPEGTSNNAFGRGQPLGAILLVLAFLIAGLVWFALRYPMPRSDGTLALAQGVTRVLWIGAVWMGLVGLRRLQALRWQRLFGLGLLAVLWLDVRTHAWDLNPTVPRSVYAANLARSYLEFPPELKPGGARAMASLDAMATMRSRALKSSTEDYLGRRLALFGNCNLLDAVPKVNGFFALYPASMDRLLEALYGEGKEATPALLDFMGVGFVTAPGEAVRWTKRAAPMPLVSAGQQPVFVSKDTAMQQLFDPNTNFRRTVLLPEDASQAVTATHGTEARVGTVAMSSGSWEVDVDAPSPAWVVVAQSFYHPWRAYVNGKPSGLFEANVAFQALEVPAGSSRVRLVYEDRMFQAGAGLSLVSWAGCLAGLAWTHRRRQRSRQEDLGA